jgi:hypothetical protein
MAETPELLRPDELDEDFLEAVEEGAASDSIAPLWVLSLIAEVRRLRSVVSEMQQAIDYAGDTIDADVP